MLLANPTARLTRKSPNLNWTKRWAELKPHAVQVKLWNDQHRFKIVPAGRRSGKTELAKRRLAEHLFRDTWHGMRGRYFAAAPTREQAKRIWWDDLKALVPRKWRKVSESELRISTRRAELWVVGLDKPDRIEGTPWDGGIVDELASCKPGIWDAHIRPALADRRGWAWLIGVPDMDAPGQVDYEQMVLTAQSGADPEWACFAWPSADILPAEEIESARRRTDPRIFEQEFLGKFVLAGGRAFPDFDANVHVNDSIAKYDPALPICWCLDFNVNPMCSGVIQHHQGEVRVIDEIVIPDTVTDVACAAFLERAAAQQVGLEEPERVRRRERERAAIVHRTERLHRLDHRSEPPAQPRPEDARAIAEPGDPRHPQQREREAQERNRAYQPVPVEPVQTIGQRLPHATVAERPERRSLSRVAALLHRVGVSRAK
jgi:hypothetical protein